ncbi:MAG: HNH endonuclease [Candidatus Eisenbacteria bacterium]|nr:HNH endonuclease [Candidatus Eisenbacteria bacterium]
MRSNMAEVVSQAADFATLSDGAILRAVAGWARAERRVTAELLRHLGELDARRLYLGAGCSSTFAYCTEILRMSEPAAYHRITAARAGRRFPDLLARLAAGELHLSAICLLASELTEENVACWIARACGQSKRAVERMLVGERAVPGVAAPMVVDGAADDAAAPARDAAARSADCRSGRMAFAEARPGPGGIAQVGRPAGPGLLLTEGATMSSASACTPSSEAASLQERAATEAVATRPAGAAFGPPKLSFAADPELQDLLARARDLVSHSNPSGDLATLLRLALRALIASTERRRFGQQVSGPIAQPDGAPAEGWSLEHVAAQAGSAVSLEAGAPVPLKPGAAAPLPAEPSGSLRARPHGLPRGGEVHAGPTVRRRAPRWRSRYIPIAVRRAVWQRDGGRCAFRSRQGHRCGTRAFLQFHHLLPFAQGGAHTVENLALRCGAHNRYEARSDVGWADRSAGEGVRSEIGPLDAKRVAELGWAAARHRVVRSRSTDGRNSPRGQCAPDSVVAKAVGPGIGCHTRRPDREGIASPPRSGKMLPANVRAGSREVARES